MQGKWRVARFVFLHFLYITMFNWQNNIRKLWRLQDEIKKRICRFLQRDKN